MYPLKAVLAALSTYQGKVSAEKIIASPVLFKRFDISGDFDTTAPSLKSLLEFKSSCNSRTAINTGREAAILISNAASPPSTLLIKAFDWADLACAQDKKLPKNLIPGLRDCEKSLLFPTVGIKASRSADLKPARLISSSPKVSPSIASMFLNLFKYFKLSISKSNLAASFLNLCGSVPSAFINWLNLNALIAPVS